jgi:hypothetical protein
MLVAMSNIEKFPVKKAERILNRRGTLALNCIVTDRWLKFGTPDWDSPEYGIPVEVDVMLDFPPKDADTPHRYFSLVVRLADLRKLLAELERTKPGAK